MSIVAGLLMMVVGTGPASAGVPAAYRTEQTQAPWIEPVRFTLAGRPRPASSQARWRLPQLSLPDAPDPEPQLRWRGPIVEFRMPLP